MKKTLTVALAALIATGSLGVASAADAQSRHDRGEYRQDQRHDSRDHRRDYRRDDRREDRREARQERREDRREYRQDRREDRQEYRQQRRAYERWQRAQRRYHAPRYVAPRGYAVRSWSYGERMPSYYRSNAYVVHDYQRYGLRQPPHGYQYVRSGDDVVLTAIAGGLIAAVIAGLFQ